MQYRFKKEANHSWLLIEDDTNPDPERYVVKMLCGGIVPGLLKCHMQNIDGKGCLLYDITSLQSLRSVYEHRKMTSSDIRMILEECIGAAESVEEYLISPDLLLMEPDYVFMSPERGRLFFCCYPEQSGDIRGKLLGLSEYILPGIDHNDRGAMALGYGFYQRVADASVPMDQLRKVLYASENKGMEELFEEPARHDPPLETEGKKEHNTLWDEDFIRDGYSGKDREKPKKSTGLRGLVIIPAAAVIILLSAMVLHAGGISRLMPLELLTAAITAALSAGILIFRIWKKRDRSKRTGVKIPDYGETGRETGQEEGVESTGADHFTDLSFFGGYSSSVGEYTEAAMKQKGKEREIPALLPEDGEYPEIPIKNKMTVVGSLPGAADVVLSSPAVSRIHARIVRKNGLVSILDLHSRNGTFLNGIALREEEEHTLRRGETVAFADVRYTFGSKTEIVF